MLASRWVRRDKVNFDDVMMQDNNKISNKIDNRTRIVEGEGEV